MVPVFNGRMNQRLVAVEVDWNNRHFGHQYFFRLLKIFIALIRVHLLAGLGQQCVIVLARPCGIIVASVGKIHFEESGWVDVVADPAGSGDHIIEERSFRAGQLHITGTVPIDRTAYYKENKPKLLRLDPYLRSYYYMFNVDTPPLNDVRVRKALAMAIDREALTSYVTRSGETPAYSFTPPHIGTYKPPVLFSTDIDAARKLLAEAGYPDGQGFPPVSLLFHISDLHTRIAEVIQQMWKDNLGVDIQLENVEWKVYQSRREHGQYDIARAEWVADYVDPASFLEVWITDGGNNHSGWSSEDYDVLIKEAALTADTTQRENLFKQAETLLIQDQPIAPLMFLPSKSLIQPSVKGWNPSILDHHPYKYIYLENK